MLELTDEPDVRILDYNLARRMAETLQAHYPDHMWAVTCQGKDGIATVRNLRLSGHWGFVLMLKEIQNDPALKKVVMAGGELLERYKISRGRYNEDDYSQLHSNNAGLFTAEH